MTVRKASGGAGRDIQLLDYKYIAGQCFYVPFSPPMRGRLLMATAIIGVLGVGLGSDNGNAPSSTQHFASLPRDCPVMARFGQHRGRWGSETRRAG